MSEKMFGVISSPRDLLPSIIIIVIVIILAGPAVFRGRLRAFGKCTDVVASSKGRLNLDSMRLIF